ncbi:hypothetical protein [Sulfoacidibacillus thermotolerans]|uniref:hypothetical protein n=1 Tax=Sulfoacidibacillus thermotolerans TaxID=1765684 RepID=UPI0011B21B5C|nr:hypothetical protein [Sulfoacidibacillus thermotolerans]
MRIIGFDPFANHGGDGRVFHFRHPFSRAIHRLDGHSGKGAIADSAICSITINSLIQPPSA